MGYAVKKWYSVQAKSASASAPAEISIFDEIGAWGVTAKDFIADLKAIDAATIKVSINSPGGSVFDALAIFNALRQHPAAIEVVIMGVAASAASFIAMAGDKITMPANAFMMIHNPLNFAYGNADELRDMADVLDKIGESIIAIYVKRTGQTNEEIKALLDAETWLNADEALEKGFCDEVQAELKVAASFDLDRLPENIRASITPVASNESDDEDPPEADPAPETSTAASLSESITAKTALAGIAMHADALILDSSIQNAADIDLAIAEAKEIIAVCKAGKMPEMASRLIAARVPLAAVRTRITESRAALDQSMPINNRLTNPQPSNAGKSAADVWAKVIPQRQTKE